MIANLKRNRKPKKLSLFIINILCLLFMITCPPLSFAENYLTLSLSSTQGAPNQTVTVNLGLSYFAEASASMFELYINYDPDVLENPSADEGDVLNNAGKEIISGTPSSGEFSIVVWGENQNIILPSEEAAYISFDIKSGAPPGQTDLTLTNLAATKSDGQPLDTFGSDGSVNVVAAIPTLSEWGMIIFITIIMGIGVMILRKRSIA